MWKGKLKDKQDPRKNWFKPLDVKQDLYNSFKIPTLKGESMATKSIGQKKPLQVKCWKCGGDHYLNKCLERKNKDASMYNVQEASTVEDVFF